MKNLKIAFACLLAGTLVSLSAQASDKVQLEGAKIGKWTMDFAAAAKLAKAEKLPMMLNFTGSDWCGWCKLMDKDVFAKDEWQKYAAKNAVLVTVDFPRDKTIVPKDFVARNKELKKQFGVSGYPTYIILDTDGKSVIGQLGAGRGKTPASFIKEFEGATRLSASSIAAYVKDHPEKAEQYKKAIAELRESKQSLKTWIATRPKRTDENTKKFEAFNKRIEEANAKLDDF